MKRSPLAFPGMRIGLFGGSFNPPHKGHLAASLIALKRLGLDRVWWLIAPQNPLKRAADTPPLETRLKLARALLTDPRIVATDIEARLGTRYSIDTVRALKARFPGVAFVLILGADSLGDLPRWKDWTRIMETIPLAIVARPHCGFPQLSSKPALRYLRRRFPAARAGRLISARPPAWIFLAGPLDPSSSTALRSLSWTGGGKSTI